MANVGEARSRAEGGVARTLDRVGGDAPSYLCKIRAAGQLDNHCTSDTR